MNAKRRRANFTIGLFAGSASPSLRVERHIRNPVKTRNPPKTRRIHSNCSMSAAPMRIITRRITSAPMTPQKSTRYWRWPGIAKAVKTRLKTKTLSTDSDSSIR